jgi:hypothetical protein
MFCDTQGPSFTAPYTRPTGAGVAGLFITPDGNFIDSVQIGQAYIANHQWGISTYLGPGQTLTTLQINALRVDCNNLASSVGVNINVGAGAGVQFVQFGDIHVRRAAIGAVLSCDNPEAFSISSLVGANITDTVLAIGSTCGATISRINGYFVTNALMRVTGTPKLTVGNSAVVPVGSVPLLDPSRGGLVPVLLNGWTYFSPNDLFKMDLNGGMVHLRGLLLPTVANTTITNIPAWARPPYTKRFVVQGYNGTGNPVAITLAVYSNGDVIVNETAGGVTNCSTWLSLSGVSWSVNY